MERHARERARGILGRFDRSGSVARALGRRRHRVQRLDRRREDWRRVRERSLQRGQGGSRRPDPQARPAPRAARRPRQLRLPGDHRDAEMALAGRRRTALRSALAADGAARAIRSSRRGREPGRLPGERRGLVRERSRHRGRWWIFGGVAVRRRRFRRGRSNMSRIFGEMRQIAFVVRDLDKALRYWTETLGVGPFFLLRDLVPDGYRYRGKPAPAPRITLALGYSGEFQVELIQQHDDKPSAYHDYLQSGREGFQHVSSWMTRPEYDAAVERILRSGVQLAHEAAMPGS